MPNYDVAITCSEGSYITRQYDCVNSADAVQAAVREAKAEGRQHVHVVEVEKVGHWFGYFVYLVSIVVVILLIGAIFSGGNP